MAQPSRAFTVLMPVSLFHGGPTAWAKPVVIAAFVWLVLRILISAGR